MNIFLDQLKMIKIEGQQLMLVQELLEQGNAETIALIDGDKRITYRQLQLQVEKYRNYFHSCGIRSGENVGLLSRNSVEYIYIYMAIASLGAVVVPINFQLSDREIAYIVKDADMNFLIANQTVTLGQVLVKQGYDKKLTLLQVLNIVDAISSQSYYNCPSLPDSFSAQETCVIIYTSGTTGSPKGAELSHHNLVSDAAMFQEALSINDKDNVLCVLPMYHCFAWTCAVLNPLFSGATITILDTFAPKETTEVIKAEKVSVVYAVPPICSLLTRSATPADLATVRIIVVGGTTLPLKIAENFTAKFGVELLEGYGLSEASPVVAVNRPGKVKAGSIGLALPQIIACIVNEEGEELPSGEVGELVVWGDNVMKGYFHLPEETEQALAGGWLHTGDMAYQDEEGYIFIVDRLKDMIISNGENIYPREIEELLYAYPDIMEATVVGINDKLRGQAGAAFIVMEAGKELGKKELKEYLQANLALYKIPREFHVVDSLPKSQTGKILKRVLVESV